MGVTIGGAAEVVRRVRKVEPIARPLRARSVHEREGGGCGGSLQAARMPRVELTPWRAIRRASLSFVKEPLNSQTATACGGAIRRDKGLLPALTGAWAGVDDGALLPTVPIPWSPRPRRERMRAQDVRRPSLPWRTNTTSAPSEATSPPQPIAAPMSASMTGRASLTQSSTTHATGASDGRTRGTSRFRIVDLRGYFEMREDDTVALTSGAEPKGDHAAVGWTSANLALACVAVAAHAGSGVQPDPEWIPLPRLPSPLAVGRAATPAEEALEPPRRALCRRHPRRHPRRDGGARLPVQPLGFLRKSGGRQDHEHVREPPVPRLGDSDGDLPLHPGQHRIGERLRNDRVLPQRCPGHERHVSRRGREFDAVHRDHEPRELPSERIHVLPGTRFRRGGIRGSGEEASRRPRGRGAGVPRGSRGGSPASPRRARGRPRLRRGWASRRPSSLAWEKTRSQKGSGTPTHGPKVQSAIDANAPRSPTERGARPPSQGIAFAWVAVGEPYAYTSPETRGELSRSCLSMVRSTWRTRIR